MVIFRLVIVSVLLVLALGGCSSDPPKQTQTPAPTPTPEKSAAARTSEPSQSELRREAVRSSGAGGGRTAAGRRLAHRTRAAQERGKKEVQHPGAGMKRPAHVGAEKPAASSVLDPKGDKLEGYEVGTEQQTRVKEIGLTDLRMGFYDAPLAEVYAHYSAQADGKGRARSKGKTATVTYQVKEGILLVALTETDGKTAVTRSLLNSKSAPERVPTWLLDLAREQKTQ